MTEDPSCAVIVPVFNEVEIADELCEHLAGMQMARQVLVVDGHSNDGTREILERFASRHNTPARPNWFCVIEGDRGRARQMNRGAALASADVLLFLHADTRLPADALGEIARALQGDRVWGRFDVRFDSHSLPLRAIAWFMNQRSFVTGIATGDQAIFVCKRVFDRVGGYPEIALMEDIALSKLLRGVSAPCRVRIPVTTAARRWRNNGVLGTVLHMWCNRILFWGGVSPERLAARYRDVR